jgi:predicted nucleic acid-binding protein
VILLDTDVCIEMLRGNRSVIDKRHEYDEEIALSFMSAAELFYGAEKSSQRKKNINLVEELLITVEIIHTNIDVLKRFGELKAALSQSGEILPDADIFIAATALMHCSMLVTGNVNHFRRIAELRIENWIR